MYWSFSYCVILLKTRVETIAKKATFKHKTKNGFTQIKKFWKSHADKNSNATSVKILPQYTLHRFDVKLSWDNCDTRLNTGFYIPTYLCILEHLLISNNVYLFTYVCKIYTASIYSQNNRKLYTLGPYEFWGFVDSRGFL